MMINRKGVLFVSLLAACLLSRAAVGQDAVTAQQVRRCINALERTPNYERTEKRAELVELGQAAVDQLITIVKGHRDAEDVNCIGHCIIALGELGAKEAGDVLIDALSSANMQLVYWAASALGQIWEGQGGTDAQSQQVNAALLALLYSDTPLAMAYGPALALIKINGIPTTAKRPEILTPEDIKAEIDNWLVTNPNSLPPVDQQPWQLNLRTALTTPDAAARQSAIQALRQKRGLGPVEPILSVLGGERSAPAGANNELAQLLGELTAVAFPPKIEGDVADPVKQVDEWRRLWFQELKQHGEPRYVAYSWQQLESGLRDYAMNPDETTAGEVKYFRAALIHQLADADAILASASPKAKELLTEPLKIKKQIGDAVVGLEAGPDDYEKRSHLKVIDEQLDLPFGRQVGNLFSERLARVAYDETNTTVAGKFGYALAKISGVPCNLDYPQIDARRARLQLWLTSVGLELPPGGPSP